MVSPTAPSRTRGAPGTVRLRWHRRESGPIQAVPAVCGPRRVLTLRDICRLLGASHRLDDAGPQRPVPGAGSGRAQTPKSGASSAHVVRRCLGGDRRPSWARILIATLVSIRVWQHAAQARGMLVDGARKPTFGPGLAMPQRCRHQGPKKQARVSSSAGIHPCGGRNLPSLNRPPHRVATIARCIELKSYRQSAPGWRRCGTRIAPAMCRPSRRLWP